MCPAKYSIIGNHDNSNNKYVTDATSKNNNNNNDWYLSR